MPDMAPTPIELPWEEVREFTNFNSKIGEGSFGDVYEGFYEDEVAVKIADYNRTTDPKFKQWEVRIILKTYFVSCLLYFLINNRLLHKK